MTLSLKQADAERVLFAQTSGELVFALINGDSNVSTGPGITNADLFG
jgi:hypothetical protein